MRFLTMYSAPFNGGCGVPLSEQQIATLNKSIEEGKKSGKLIETLGLMPPTQGAQVSISDQEISVTDGPFIEAKEFVGGFAIFEFASKEEAIESAKSFLQLMGAGTVEIRQIM